mgnify:CR=1 FL=1
MGVRERGVCDVRRDAHGRRLQRGWLGFLPTPLPGAFDWMLSGDGSISREYAHLGVVCPQKLWIHAVMWISRGPSTTLSPHVAPLWRYSFQSEYDTQRYSSEDWRRRSAGCSGAAAGSHAASPGLPGRLAKAGCAGFPA